MPETDIWSVTLDEAIAIPCTACGAGKGQPCWPDLTSARDVRKVAYLYFNPDEALRKTHPVRLREALRSRK
jgi:hypothetical protein